MASLYLNWKKEATRIKLVWGCGNVKAGTQIENALHAHLNYEGWPATLSMRCICRWKQMCEWIAVQYSAPCRQREEVHAFLLDPWWLTAPLDDALARACRVTPRTCEMAADLANALQHLRECRIGHISQCMHIIRCHTHTHLCNFSSAAHTHRHAETHIILGRHKQTRVHTHMHTYTQLPMKPMCGTSACRMPAVYQ